MICNRRLLYLALRRKGLTIDLTDEDIFGYVQRVLTSAEVLFFSPRKLNHCFWRGKHDLIYHRKGIPVIPILLLPSAHSMADARHNTLFSALNIPFRLQNQLLFCTDTKIECVRLTSSNSQIQNKRATKGFILIRHKRYQI